MSDSQTIVEALDPKVALFVDPARWTDMDTWHDEVADLRATNPVLDVDVPGLPAFSVLTRHADVFAVSRDHEHWNNTPRSVLTPDLEWQKLIESGMPLPKTLVHLDGDEHRDHRAVTNDWFKPAAIRTRQSRIDEIAAEFVQKMRDFGGECDFAADIAQPYTLRAIMDIYGVPQSDERLMLELTQGLFGAADPEFMGDAENPEAKLLESVMTFIQYFNDLTEKRRECPGDDLATVIANGQVNGCPMGDAERLWYYIIVATAGHDTTSFALSGGMEALLRHPDQVDALKTADADAVVKATDEIIRWTSPVRHFMRHAVAPTQVAGVDVEPGAQVLLSYPSANRDEHVFADSMQFDTARPDADKLLSFGVGAHFCLGAQFARREIRTMLTHLMPQLESIEPAGTAAWSASGFVSGVKHLPVTYRFR